MALIHDDEADIRERGEERRARSNDHLDPSQTGPPPGVVAFAF